MSASTGVKLVDDVCDEEFRRIYLADFVKTMLAYQIKSTRRARGMSQGDLAKNLGTRQSAISRLESTDYGKMKLELLIKLAHVFNTALVVKFVDYYEFLRSNEEVQEYRWAVAGFEEIRADLLNWATELRSQHPTVEMTESSPKTLEAKTPESIYLKKDNSPRRRSQRRHMDENRHILRSE